MSFETYIDLSNYCILFGSSIFINKYVLSVLKFTYPTVFQGWQMLVGVILLKILMSYKCISSEGSKLDKAGFVSLFPSFILFAAGIVASSKALADMSIPIFLCLQNTLNSTIYLMENFPFPNSQVTFIGLIASFVTLASAAGAVILELNMMFIESPYFWMVVSLGCMSMQSLHNKFSDARYNEADRLFYCYFFSVIILAPASLYLEEAFEVLNFQNASRYDFYAGCLLSGIIGLFLNLVALKVRSDKHYTTTDALSRLLVSALSLVVFGDSTKHVQKVVVFVNLVAAVFVPQSLQPPPEKYPFTEDTETLLESV